MSSEEKVEDKAYILHKVEHFRQRFNWDCGVSCVLMLLSEDQRAEMLSKFDEICAEEGFGQSTWTIDLCYLLKRFGIKHLMYTKMLGVNDSYMKQGYYSKIIPLDRGRVESRFARAASAGVSVSAGCVSSSQLARHVRRGPALLLVDAGLLMCCLCKHNQLQAQFRRCFGGAYRGHYILVVGHDARADKFLYRDPALSARLCAARAPCLERARTAPGTDADTVLVCRDYQ